MRLHHRIGVLAALIVLALFYMVSLQILANDDQGQQIPQYSTNTDGIRDATKIVKTVESENSRRLERVASVCRKYNLGLYKSAQVAPLIKHPPTPQYQVFFFNRAHKWSICPIYKAGSTTWLFHLLLLAGMTEEEIDNSGKQLSELAREKYPQEDPANAEELLHTTLKIMTVRHPFERVLSAYRDKLENINHGWEHGTKHFYEAFGKKIVKKYRQGGSAVLNSEILDPADYKRDPRLPAPAGVEPTFKEFVRYLIDSNLVSQADDHWIPFYLYCTPCLVKYEFIAKTETLDQDQMYIIRSLGLEDVIKPRWRHKTQFDITDTSQIVSELSKIYFHQLTTGEIEQLYTKYKVDFELFGYDYQQYLTYAKDFKSVGR